jgi:formyl-CoA transferase
VGPLAGVRVVELGTVVAASFATRMLGDLGAEVIKVEAPDALDPLREWGRGRYRDRALWWPVQSRNKKLVTINLRERAGQQLLLRLVRPADVLIENFRPGTLESWNLGWDQLSAANPRLVFARVSGFGQTGPYARRGGYAAIAEAMGGLRYGNGFPGGPPPRFGISLGDELAGLFAAQGILAALYHRDTHPDGEGQVIDVSLAESCMALLESAFPEWDLLAQNREPTGTRIPAVAPSNLFATRDGKDVVIAANQDGLFRRLCGVMGRPALAEDPRYSSHLARAEHQDEVEAEVAAWVAGQDAAEVERLLVEAGVPCGQVYTVADIFEDEHYRERGMLVDHHDEELGRFTGPGVVPKFSRTAGAIRWSGIWEAGRHNAEIFGGLLGLQDAELGELRRGGVI